MGRTGIKNSNILWSAFAVILNAGINLLMVPYITARIGIDAYGFISLGNNLISYVDMISMALNSYAGRYIAIAYHQQKTGRANQYYSSLMIADIALCAILSIPCGFFIVFSDRILSIPDALVSDVKILFMLLLFRYFFVIMRNALDAAVFIKNRLDLTAKIRTGSYLVQAAMLILLYSLFDARTWFAGFAGLVSAVFFFFLQYLAKNRLIPVFHTDRRAFSMEDVKTFLGLGIWNVVTNLGNVLNTGLDLLITNLMLDAMKMGEISVAKTVSTLTVSLTNAVAEAQKPKQMEAYSKNDNQELILRLKRSMRLCGSLSFLILAVFLTCGLDFFQLWIPEQDTWKVYRLTVLALIGNAIVGLVFPLYYLYALTKHVKLPSLLTVLYGVINVVSMILLIRSTNLMEYAVLLTTAMLDCCHLLDAPLYGAHCLGVKKGTFYPEIVACSGCFIVSLLLQELLCVIIPVASNWSFLILKLLLYTAVGSLPFLPFVLKNTPLRIQVQR
jgi:O-antigen/teichoic acid export membrane protein